MSIFPSDYSQGNNNGTTVVTTTSTTPKLLKEYAIDFDRGEILIDDDGKFTIVEGIEAVKVRCWLALQIQRNRYTIYPSGIGNELKSLIGKGISYVNKNIQTILEDALIDGTYVTTIEDISVTQDSDVITIDFTINSIYGSYTDTTTTY
jgi:hypothetical protein